MIDFHFEMTTIITERIIFYFYTASTNIIDTLMNLNGDRPAAAAHIGKYKTDPSIYKSFTIQAFRLTGL